MLKTNICGVEFQNPLMLAAGIMGSSASSMNWILKSGAGGVVSKSFSLNPHPGYVNPTTVGVDGGMRLDGQLLLERAIRPRHYRIHVGRNAGYRGELGRSARDCRRDKGRPHCSRR